MSAPSASSSGRASRPRPNLGTQRPAGEPLSGGGSSFLIQIDPTLAGQLRTGDQIEGDLPADLKDIRTFLISVGTKILPSGGAGRPVASTTSDTSRPALPPSLPTSLIDRPASTSSTGISPLPKARASAEGESGTPTLGKRLGDLTRGTSTSANPKGSSSLGASSRFDTPPAGSPSGVLSPATSPAASSPSTGFPAASSAPTYPPAASSTPTYPLAASSSSPASSSRAPGLFSFGARAPSSYLERQPEERQAGYNEARSAPSTPLDRGPLAQSFRPELSPQAESAHPWALFVVVLGVLCASLGGNLYFGWMFWEIRPPLPVAAGASLEREPFRRRAPQCLRRRPEPVHLRRWSGIGDPSSARVSRLR